MTNIRIKDIKRRLEHCEQKQIKKIAIISANSEYSTERFSDLSGVPPEADRFQRLCERKWGLTVLRLDNFLASDLYYIFDMIDRLTFGLTDILHVCLSHSVNYGLSAQLIDRDGESVLFDDLKECICKFNKIIITNVCRGENSDYKSRACSNDGDPHYTKKYGKFCAEFSTQMPGYDSTDSDDSFITLLEQKSAGGYKDLVTLLNDACNIIQGDANTPDGTGWWPLNPDLTSKLY